MQVITFTAFLACAAAAPGLLLHETHLVHAVPLTAKSTLTKSSQVVDHGSTYIQTPVVHSVPVHSVAVHAAPSSKTTVTKSNLNVNHGGTRIVHSIPVVHEPIHYVHEPLHTFVHAPAKSSQYFNLDNTVYHTPESSKTETKYTNQVSTLVHAPLVSVHSSPVYSYVHSSPVETVRTGDSAVSHHSSTVHETVPVVKHLPLYTLHH